MSDVSEIKDDETTLEDLAAPKDDMVRKKQIVEHVSLTTGVKKREVREALDVAFAYIREQLLEGNEVAYPTLGKVKIKIQNPESEQPKAMYRVALAKDSENDDSGLADGEE